MIYSEKRKAYQKEYNKKNRVKQSEYQREYSKINKERIAAKNHKFYLENKEKILARQRALYDPDKEKLKHKKYYEGHKKEKAKYYQDNKKKIQVKKRACRLAFPERYKATDKKYTQSHRKEINLRRKEQYHNDLEYRIGFLLRGRVRRVIKKNKKMGSAVKDIGCTLGEVRGYLEDQFTEGMTWENMGKDGWHIDHKIPLSLFDLTDREQFLRACHYTNLQPLWAVDNIKKYNKLITILK